jgi:quinol monooxygenase YgiN
MVKVALLARLVARTGKEEELATFLAGALPLAEAERETTVWFAIRLGPTEFGIFDAFADDRGRQAHLDGKIAQALMTQGIELLAEPPSIQPVDVLAAKLSKI